MSDWDTLLGKTITRVTTADGDKFVCLFFSDGTHQCLGYDSGWEAGDTVLCLEEDPVYDETLRELDLLSKEEYQGRLAEQEARKQNQNRESRYRQYQALKQEFEGEGK